MIIEEREAFMISTNGDDETPNYKNAHFLKPSLNPKNDEPLPKYPSLSLPSKPNIKVHLKGRPIPQKNWHLWVGNMQKIHEDTWKKVGIFDAIRASTYKLLKDKALIIELAKFWCDETKSFIFPWGECTITLEDVMILGGFSVLGENVHTPFQSKEVEEIENKLMSVFNEERKNRYDRIEQQAWMDYFMGFGGDLEHIALIVLWLSRYVFPKKYYCQISPSVVPIAISLVRGTRIALAPAVLASLYQDMGLLKHEMVSCVNEMNMSTGSNKHVLWAPMQLIQLWAWERFPTLGPRPITLLRGEPRLARWQDSKPARIKPGIINFEAVGESYVWRPYVFSIENWELPQFYGDEDRLVLLSSEVGEELLSFARCLRPCELVGLDCIEQYLPHRVALQFGLDQDIPCSIQRLNGSVEHAWSTYDVSLDGVKLYLTPRLLQGDETVRYFTWFRTAICLSTHSSLVFNQQRVKQSQGLDTILLDNSDFALASSPSTLYNVPMASCSEQSVGVPEGLIEATTSCDKRAPTPCNNHVDNSKCLPSPSPNDAYSNYAQNVNGNYKDSNNEALPCLSSSDTFALDSALTGSTGEKYDERMPSSEKGNSFEENCDDDDNENMLPLCLENAVEKAVMGMDTLMEELAKCREDFANMSSNRFFDSVEAKNIETTPPFNNNLSPTRSHYNHYQGLPSQSTKRDADEVASLMNSPMAKMEEVGKIHEDTNRIEMGTDSRLLEGARPRDEILVADDNDNLSYEPDQKKICLVNAVAEQGKIAKSASLKSGSNTLDDKFVIVDDDDEDKKAKDDLDPVEVLGSKLLQFEASINKLQKVVSKMQAKKFKSKVKKELACVMKDR